MRIAPYLSVLFSQLQRRQTYDSGQYTIIPTLVSWTESYYTSYWSTQIITVTTKVPCPVYTSYTTVTQCSECGCPDCGPTTPVVVGGLVCVPKTCSIIDNGVVDYSSTPYENGDYAPATLNGVLNPETTYVPASECSSYEAFVPTGYEGADISECGGGGGGGTTTIDEGTCGASIVTYTYTTGGATIVVATNIQSHCGPFKLSGGGNSNRVDASNAQLIFWVWSIIAMVSGIGMIFL